MAKFLLFTYFLLTCMVITSHARQHAHAPSVAPKAITSSPSMAPKAPSSSTSSDDQCSSIIYDMVDCLSYLSAGSTDAKPEDSCCSGFELVVEANAMCLCEAIESSADMGIELNMTRASTLSSDCGLSTNPFKSCKIPKAPQASATPAKSPSHNAIAPATTTSPADAPAEVTDIHAPAPSPSSGTSTISASFIFLVTSIFVGSVV